VTAPRLQGRSMLRPYIDDCPLQWRGRAGFAPASV